MHAAEDHAITNSAGAGDDVTVTATGADVTAMAPGDDVTASVRVRLAERADMPHVLAMIQELAEFEGVPQGPQLRVADLERDGFDSATPWFFVLVAELGGRVVGQALASRAYSSWSGRALYLEDLFVRPAARRRGVATALLITLCQMGTAEGATRVDWHVLESNAGARSLYARLGALDLRDTEGRAALRLPHSRILAIAEQGARALLPHSATADTLHDS